MKTTFQKYGGFSAVSRIVMSFYEMVLDNDEVGHHFDDVDMPRLIDHQTKFISSLMGGPEAISDDRLEMVHRKFGISHREFDIVLGLLSEAMRENGLEEADVQEVARVFDTKRGCIVKQDPP